MRVTTPSTRRLVVTAAAFLIFMAGHASAKPRKKKPATPAPAPLRIVVPVRAAAPDAASPGAYSSMDLICPAGEERLGSCQQGSAGGVTTVASSRALTPPAALATPPIVLDAWTTRVAGAGASTQLPGLMRVDGTRGAARPLDNLLFWASKGGAEAWPTLAVVAVGAVDGPGQLASKTRSP